MSGMVFSKNDTNAMKGIAILFMMFHHCFATPDRFEKYDVSFAPLSQEWGVLLSYTLKICVGMFVFLSAYGMTIAMKSRDREYSLSASQVAAFTSNRLIRLMGGYMLVFILTHVISIALGQGRMKVVYGEGVKACIGVIIDFFGLGDVMGTPVYIATWWYMSLAIILILVFPFLVFVYKKSGIFSIPLIALVPFVFTIQYTNMIRYIPVMIVGVVFADRNWMVKIRQWKIKENSILSHGIKFILEIFLIYGLFKGRNSEYNYQLIAIWDSFLPVVILLFSYEFVAVIPGFRTVLKFIGKHSMNIFLTHNFFRVFWCPDFIYHFRSAWLISLALLGVSLVFSIMIELLKKLIHFNQGIECIRKKVESKILNMDIGVGSNDICE